MTCQTADIKKGLIREIPQTSSEHLEVYGRLTVSERKICDYLYGYFINNKKINPCHKRIAEKSKCTDRTVKRFFQKYKGILFEWFSGKQFHKTNSYKLNNNFFKFIQAVKQEDCEHLLTARFRDLNRHQKEMKSRLILEICSDENWVMNKLSTKKYQKCPTQKCQKCPTKNSLLKNSLSEYKVPLKVSSNETKKEKTQFQEFDEWFKNIAITPQEKKRLFYTFGCSAIRSATEDFRFYRKQNTVDNYMGLLYSRAKYHTLKTMRVSK